MCNLEKYKNLSVGLGEGGRHGGRRENRISERETEQAGVWWCGVGWCGGNMRDKSLRHNDYGSQALALDT